MNKEQANGYLKILKEVPGSRHWNIRSDFEQTNDGDEVRETFCAGLFIGPECFVAVGDNAEQAVVRLVRQAAAGQSVGRPTLISKAHMKNCRCPECDPVFNDPQEQGRGEITEL